MSTLLNTTLSKLLTVRDSLIVTDLDQMANKHESLANSGQFSREYADRHSDAANRLRNHREVVRGRKTRFWNQPSSEEFIEKQSTIVTHLQKVTIKR